MILKHIMIMTFAQGELDQKILPFIVYSYEPIK